MYTPHVVTLYNVTENPQTLELEYNVTVLSGVFLDKGQAANIEKTGLRDADAATLFVPFSVVAYEPAVGKTGSAVAGEAIVGIAVAGREIIEKQYVSPKEYRRMADHFGYWTFEPGGVSSGVDCFFIKGEVIVQDSYKAIRENYDDVYDVSVVDTRDFGSEDMQHWQVGGR